MEFDTTMNLTHLNGIQLTKIIQYLILIDNMTICHTMTLCPIDMTLCRITNKLTLIQSRYLIRLTIDNISVKS